MVTGKGFWGIEGSRYHSSRRARRRIWGPTNLWASHWLQEGDGAIPPRDPFQTYEKCILSKFADDTNLGWVLAAPDSCSAIQRNLHSLGKWTNRNLMKFVTEKCKVLSLGRNSPMHHYMLVVNCLASYFAEKHLGVLVASKLPMTQSRSLATKKADGVLGWSRTGIVSKSGNEEEGWQLFSVVPSGKTKGKGHKLKYIKFHLNTRGKKLCTESDQTLAEVA